MRSVRLPIRRRSRSEAAGTTLAGRIAGGRAVAGALVVAAPEPFARALGCDAATAARVSWLTRMMGIRDSAIGIGGVAAARSGGDARAWLLAGAVSDAVDAAVVLGALRSGRLKGAGPTVLVPVASGAAVAGLVAALAGSARRG